MPDLTFAIDLRKLRGTEREPSRNVSISVVPFVKVGSGTGAIGDKVRNTTELLLCSPSYVR
jgi:hypothetical protein